MRVWLTIFNEYGPKLSGTVLALSDLTQLYPATVRITVGIFD